MPPSEFSNHEQESNSDSESDDSGNIPDEECNETDQNESSQVIDEYNQYESTKQLIQPVQTIGPAPISQ